MSVAIIAITEAGANLARSLQAQMPDTDLYLPEKWQRSDNAEYFSGKTTDRLRQLFTEGNDLICIMATGIVFRALAPVLKGKDVDPAVVVCDEKGQHAISLLSGHLGGANALSEEVANCLGARAVITTATDVQGIPAWDEVARRENHRIEPITRLKEFNSFLLEGKRVALIDPKGVIAIHFREQKQVLHMTDHAQLRNEDVAGMVLVNERLIPDLEHSDDLLLIRPPLLAIGIGCNRGTSMEEIEREVAGVLADLWLSPLCIARIGSIDAKNDEEGLLAYARKLQRPISFYTSEELNRVEVPTEPSEHVMQAVGAKGVCEPAALMAAGAEKLMVKKQKRGNVTVALAVMAAMADRG